MNLGPTLHCDNGLLLSRAGLSRRVLRQLIQTSQLGIGSRVLQAGDGCGGLNDFLSSLGMQVWEINDPVVFADRGSPHSAGAALSLFDKRGFDLVLVHDLAAHRRSLHLSTALRATAELLSLVCPGGTLSFVQPARPASHEVSCFKQHLGHFSGTVDAFASAEGGMQHAAWQHLFGRADVGGSFVASLTIPAKPLTDFEWHRAADESAGAAPCCRLCREAPPHAASLPKAA